MTLKSSTIVTLEKPTPSLGAVMNEIRSWLDTRKIEPIEFKTASIETGGVAVEIRFATQDEANLFDLAFT